MDSDEDTSYQREQAYYHSTSYDEESSPSNRCGKDPAGRSHCTKKGKENRRPKELKGVITSSI